MKRYVLCHSLQEENICVLHIVMSGLIGGKVYGSFTIKMIIIEQRHVISNNVAF